MGRKKTGGYKPKRRGYSPTSASDSRKPPKGGSSTSQSSSQKQPGNKPGS